MSHIPFLCKLVTPLLENVYFAICQLIVHIAQQLRIAAISEKSKFPHISADINDIKWAYSHSFHSFIDYADIKRLDYVLMLNEYKNINIQEIRYVRGL